MVNIKYWQNWQWSSLFEQIEVVNDKGEIKLIGLMGKNTSEKLVGIKIILSRQKKDKNWFCQVQEPKGRRVILDKWPPRGCSMKWE